MATGGGYSPLNEVMATINFPGISKKAFINIETQIGRPLPIVTLCNIFSNYFLVLIISILLIYV